MGRDKAVLKVGDRPMINRAHDTARKVFGRRIIIVSSRHSEFPGVDAPVFPDIFPSRAPIVGIVSALLHASTPYVFVVACDMPNLSADAFQYMLDEIHGGEDIIIPRTELGFQPLHALYNKSCISYLLTAIERNILKIQDTFPYLSIRELRDRPWFGKDYCTFANINTEEDLSIIPGMDQSKGKAKKKKANPMIVTAAVIERDGHILIAKRKRGQHAGSWEFPGGTLEEGETHEQCLKRELQEELAVEAEIGELMCTSEYAYTPDWTIRLLAYRATVVSGVLSLNDHEEMRWVKPTDLADYDFTEPDRPIVEILVREDRG